MKTLIFAAAMLVASAAGAVTPERGWWWNPQEPGWGLSIEAQRDAVLIATFIYDETGTPIWYSGTGELDDSTVTAPLLRFDGGQCIGCPYQAPSTTGGPGSVTIEFTSPSTATLTWSGKSITIERFNFNLAEGIQQLLGEWLFLSKEPSEISSYQGDRITFNRIAGEKEITGSRTGVPSEVAIASVVDVDIPNGFSYLITIEESQFSTSVFAFNLKGLNKIEGIGATVSSLATSSEIWDTLEKVGQPFEAYRAE